MTQEATLEDIIAELYSVPPSDFVACRNARAKKIGDRALAADVRALRKPSMGAWVVNVYAREQGSELDEALQLAQELRDAQAELDAPALAKLGRERRALTKRLSDNAVALATSRGGTVSAATRDAVQQTISTAFFDAHAAAAVASGRLLRDLETSGVFPVDASETVAGGLAAAPSPVKPRTDELSERRKRRKAEHAVDEAEQQLARAERDRATAERETREATRHSERLAVQVAELEQELARTRDEAQRTHAEISEASERQKESDERVVAAKRAVTVARDELKQLSR